MAYLYFAKDGGTGLCYIFFQFCASICCNATISILPILSASDKEPLDCRCRFGVAQVCLLETNYVDFLLCASMFNLACTSLESIDIKLKDLDLIGGAGLS